MTLRFLTSGESHGAALLAILEGMPAGFAITAESINDELKRRQSGPGSGGRMKIEKDQVRILSGIMEGKTTGAPIGMLIENLDHVNWVGRQVKSYTIPRPGHADLSGAVKYAHNDLRPILERASARETAARVAVGAVCRQFLAHFNIHCAGYLSSLGSVRAHLDDMPLTERIANAQQNDVRCPDPQAATDMLALIQQTIEQGETLGGVIEAVMTGIPTGLGSHVHWDRRLDARIGAAILGIQAIKGIEIGPAFENTTRWGTQVQDPILLQDDHLTRSGNRCGGLEGGITNGEPLIVRAAMKPIATTLKTQNSVDLATSKTVPIEYERSDFTPVIRAIGVVEAMLSFVLADALLEKLGGDSLQEIEPRFNSLRKTSLQDLKMQTGDHVWWSA